MMPAQDREGLLDGLIVAVNLLTAHPELAPSDVGFADPWPFYVHTVEDALAWIRVMNGPPRSGLIFESTSDRLRLFGQIRGLKVLVILRQHGLAERAEEPHPSDPHGQRTWWRIPKALADAIDLTDGNIIAPLVEQPESAS
ncbi:hypothetical protein ACFWYW_19745 [Nonomuraea sp. NPDC059023]|uniref:hypothetical protein n=2 Tax=unclassified Nonomuraea TaxID=2593643 RepID=UPI003678210B